jgi:hypothetical protein
VILLVSKFAFEWINLCRYAVYASKPENQDDIDRVMLLAPTFKLESVIGSLEEQLGITLSDAFKADAKNHPEFPFLKCRAYVVHGYDDEAAPLANSLTWVRDASVGLALVTVIL